MGGGLIFGCSAKMGKQQMELEQLLIPSPKRLYPMGFCAIRGKRGHINSESGEREFRLTNDPPIVTPKDLSVQWKRKHASLILLL
jgi:hypothetical protein